MLLDNMDQDNQLGTLPHEMEVASLNVLIPIPLGPINFTY